MGLMCGQTTRRWLVGAIAFAVLRVCRWRSGSLGADGFASVRVRFGPSGGRSGVVLDRLVAVVNGDMILESDVDEERRFEEIQPYRSAVDSTRAEDYREAGGSSADSAAGGAAA